MKYQLKVNIMYYTTLNRIWECRPSGNGWKKLLRFLGKTHADDEPLSLKTILESNGIEDALWALRAVDDPMCERDARLFCVRCVRQCPSFLTDKRLFTLLDVAERYACGDATDSELKTARETAQRGVWDNRLDMGWGIVLSITQDAIRDAAWGVAQGAAWGVAQGLTWAVTWAATLAAAKEAQEKDFREIFCA